MNLSDKTKVLADEIQLSGSGVQLSGSGIGVQQTQLHSAADCLQ